MRAPHPLTRPASAAALAALVIGAHGCCSPPPTADVLVVNTTDAPLIAEVVQKVPGGAPDAAPEAIHTSDPIAPGAVASLVGHMGDAELILRASGGQTLRREPVTLRMEDTALVTAQPESCVVVADYTPQYGPNGSGQIAAVATARAGTPGRFDRHNLWLILAPIDTMPDSIVEDTTLHRIVAVDCALLDQPSRLQHHLAHLR